MSAWRATCAALFAVALLGLPVGAPAQGSRPLLEVRPEPARDPWWQRATWHPRATTVRGIPVRRLHPDWCAAEAFAPEMFGDALLGGGAGSPLEGLAFSQEGSFDGSGKPQLAFVGAYRRCNGEQGLFMAIVEPQPSRTRMRFLVEVPDAPSAFAALGREPDGTLAVWWCAACDDGHRVAFSREAKGFFVAGPATHARQ